MVVDIELGVLDPGRPQAREGEVVGPLPQPRRPLGGGPEAVFQRRPGPGARSSTIKAPTVIRNVGSLPTLHMIDSIGLR